MKFRAISNNQRKLDLNWNHINLYLSRWKPGTVFDIEITKRQPKKSDPIRRYYWAAVLPPFMEHLGYEPDDALDFHRQLKIVFYQVKPDKKGIYRKKDIPSVFSNESTLTIEEKKKFVDWVIRTAAREGVYIPDPE